MEQRDSRVETTSTSTSSITIHVNGRAMTVERDCPLPRLIENLGLDRRFLVVEYNGEARRREDFDTLVLKEGDRLELVLPVAGG